MSLTATFTSVCFLVLDLQCFYKSNRLKQLLQHVCNHLCQFVVCHCQEGMELEIIQIHLL